MGAYLTWQTSDGAPSKKLYFDLVREEEQTLAATATDNPVESGVNVSDHVKQELDRLALTVRVTNTPVFDVNHRGGALTPQPLDVPTYTRPIAPTPGGLVNAAGGALSSMLGGIAPPLAANVLTFSNVFDAIKETLETLEQLKTSAQLVTIYCPSRTYRNMFLQTLGISRDGKSGASAEFKLEFKQIRKVEAKIVTAPVPTEIRGISKKPKGAQGTKVATPQEKDSILLSGAKKLPDSIKKPFGIH